MNVDPYGRILPEENTTIKVDSYELNVKGNKKEDQRDWVALDEKGRKIQYRIGNDYKPVIISGAFAPNLRHCNVVKYKRVNNPDMFRGDSTDLRDPKIRGFAWVPCGEW